MKRSTADKFQTRMREDLRTYLKTAGDCIRLVDREITDNKRLRSAAIQSAKLENMTIEVRTVNNHVYARRSDIPNLSSRSPSRCECLLSFRPWPDDEHFYEKVDVILAALSLNWSE